MSKQGSSHSILLIGDLHAPYNHPDAFKFLDKIDETYNPKHVFCMGDEIDGHAISFHDSDPDLLSPGNELEQAIYEMKNLYILFPRVKVIESNHGSLVYRRAKRYGLPLRVLKSYSEILEAPKGWSWHDEIYHKLPNGELLYLTHGKSSPYGGLSRDMGMHTAQGHYHQKFGATWTCNGPQLRFDIFTGCLIDAEHLAFEYGKNSRHKPMLGAVIIKDNYPICIPLRVNTKGRWIGKI